MSTVPTKRKYPPLPKWKRVGDGYSWCDEDGFRFDIVHNGAGRYTAEVRHPGGGPTIYGSRSRTRAVDALTELRQNPDFAERE